MARETAHDAYRSKTGIIPIAGQKLWLDLLCHDYGAAVVIEAIDAEPDGSHIGFLARLSGRLRRTWGQPESKASKGSAMCLTAGSTVRFERGRPK